jgi:hypothetical protein
MAGEETTAQNQQAVWFAANDPTSSPWEQRNENHENQTCVGTVPVAIGAPVAARTTSVTAKIEVVLLLSKMSIRQRRWYGQ